MRMSTCSGAIRSQRQMQLPVSNCRHCETQRQMFLCTYRFNPPQAPNKPFWQVGGKDLFLDRVHLKTEFVRKKFAECTALGASVDLNIV